jgi:hypothetical protein
MKDRIVLMITATICIVVVTATIGPLITGTPATQEKADLLANLVSSLIAIVSFSLGRDSKKEG